MLRKYLLMIMIYFWCSSASGQSTNFEDGFEDADFTDNPSWSGDAESFIVTNAEPNFLLQLNAVDSGPSHLSTPSSNTVGSWEFYIVFSEFEPSGSNKAEIFLMSDRPDLEGQVNGYALRAGESGDDVFRIVRYDNGTETAIILSDTTVIDSQGGGYRIKVVRDDSGNWQLLVGSGYQGSLVDSGNKANDNTHTTSTHFGVKVTFTSSRSDKFFFDFKIDLPPFEVNKVSPSGNFIDIIFNRPYEPSTVQISDFSLNNGFSPPSSLDFPDTHTVRLNYESALISNKYALTVSNIDDQNGETLAEGNITKFIVFGAFEAGDIVINEFMYDPPLGLAEYVELRNTSLKYLNLKNWQIGDLNGIGTISKDTLVIAPERFLVVSADTTALYKVFGTRNYLQLSSGNFPSLNNSGDAIRILGENSTLIDSLYYAPEWGGEDIALERRSAAAPSSKMANWGESTQGTGTPGISNQISADIAPPLFSDLQIIDPATVRLLFSEELHSVSAADVNKYTISPNPGIHDIIAHGDTVTISLSQKLQSGLRYRITVSGIEDIFGNAMGTESKEITYLEFRTPSPRDIVINEIGYNRIGDIGAEFVELYNTSSKNFDLSGWKIGDSSKLADLPAHIIILPGEYLVLTDDLAFATSLNNARHIPGFPSLNDSGDIIYIQSNTGITIDTLHYLQNWGNDEDGHSLERIDPLAASNDPSNWSESKAKNQHTASLQNSVLRADETPPKVIFAKQLDEKSIKVQFNEFIKLTPDLSFHAEGVNLSISDFDPANANIVELKVPVVKSMEEPSRIIVQGLTDVKGNVTVFDEIAIAQKLTPGSVVINEIMYNPLDDVDDHQPDQSEYIELRNTRNVAVSLEGISLSDAPDENGEVQTLVPVTTEAMWLAANGLALIYAEEETDFAQSRLARFFELSNDINLTPIRIDRSTLSLASSDDAIFLSDSSGNAIDSVFYDESWQNPNLFDTRGIALERIDPLGPSNNSTNWSSSTTLRGGTPHSENSIFQIANNIPEQTGLSFSPNPFSPDDDGIDDNLFINYKLDEPDYLLKARIYDRYGRLVRNLTDNERAGFEGSLLWDGRNNDGSRNRIGIYIVVIEAFNSANGKNIAFKETVVLARRLN